MLRYMWEQKKHRNKQTNKKKAKNSIKKLMIKIKKEQKKLKSNINVKAMTSGGHQKSCA